MGNNIYLFLAQREVRTQKVHELTLIHFVDKHDKAMLDSETVTLSRQCVIQWIFIAFLLFVSCWSFLIQDKYLLKSLPTFRTKTPVYSFVLQHPHSWNSPPHMNQLGSCSHAAPHSDSCYDKEPRFLSESPLEHVLSWITCFWGEINWVNQTTHFQ